MQTPAPHRVIPHLAPPSTAQRPSQHMPTSSPAPFWKFAELGGATPMKGPAFDMSPTKGGGDLGVPPSSSPPPAHRASPSRNGRSTKLEVIEADEAGEDEEEGGFDLSRYVKLEWGLFVPLLTPYTEAFKALVPTTLLLVLAFSSLPQHKAADLLPLFWCPVLILLD